MSSALAFFLISASTVGTDFGAPIHDDLNLIPIERNIIRRTNEARARAGLQPLAIDSSLVYSARTHAAMMARNRVMRHASQSIAENIAKGQTSSTSVVSDWMRSPGHRANILHSAYTRIGAAAYRGTDGQIYWCQQFLR